ncbi:hypothetical protein BaRGS_00035056 [Batillaria attramentaria]|uniref:Uncharacterized protein n=1 Tax=Batillaria attramentaria TaxID=370345 RepID=A0ABD0JFI6_9CAEN
MSLSVFVTHVLEAELINCDSPPFVLNSISTDDTCTSAASAFDLCITHWPRGRLSDAGWLKGVRCGYGSFPRLPSFDSSFAPRPRRVSAHCKFYNFGATSTMFEALECVFSEYNFTPKASSPGVVES